MNYTSLETPPGCADALDLDTGVWVRIRHLLSSELMAAGVTPMASVVMPGEATSPPSSARQAEMAALSERITAESTVAASIVEPGVYDAYRAARDACTRADADAAKLQAIADAGGSADDLPDARARAADARAAMESTRAAAMDPVNRRPWKAIRVVCVPPETSGDPGLVYLGDLPGSVLNTVAVALNARREAAANALRSFLGG